MSAMSTVSAKKEAHFGQRVRPVLALKLVAGRGIARLGLVHLPPEGCGMARAFALGDPSFGAVRWRSADRCRIALQGEDWLISNHSGRLVCALNGRRIRTGEKAILQVGDTLELDLLRFLIVDPSVHRGSDPLGSLDIGRHASHRVDASRDRSEATDDLLDRLHDEFMAAARDPLQLSGREDWCHAALPVADEAPTIEELCAQAMPFPLLRDLLLPREPVDRIIEGFDALGAVDLAQEAIREDVLRLFAPAIENSAPARLPGLTRREHHVVSIDSAMTLGAVRPGDDRTLR